MMHLLALHGAESLQTSFETDRMRFIGRNNSVETPAAMQATKELSGTQGSVLDPVVSIRHRVLIAARSSGRVRPRSRCRRAAGSNASRSSKSTGIATSPIARSRSPGRTTGSRSDRSTSARSTRRSMRGSPARSSTPIPRAGPAPRRSPATGSRSRACGRTAFRAICRSCCCRCPDPKSSTSRAQLVNAHVYCRMKGLDFDLVIWNEERGGYRQALHDEIMAIIGTSADAGMLEQPGGVFVRSIEQINHEDRVLMHSIARVVMSDPAGIALRAARRRQGFAQRHRRARARRLARARSARQAISSRCRRARWSTVSAVSRRMAANMSSRSTKRTRRRCRGST